ncbi:MAG: hypothetical protein WBA23_23690 [Tunicatimonas sp.]
MDSIISEAQAERAAKKAYSIGSNIQIVRVLHGRRDMENLF